MSPSVIDTPQFATQRLDGAISLVERRQSVRYDAVAYRSWIGWWDGDNFEVATAILANISRGGAMVNTIYHPPAGSRIWFCLHADPWIGSVSATVLEASSCGIDQCRVRIAFDEPCPDSVFAAAVLGLEAA